MTIKVDGETADIITEDHAHILDECTSLIGRACNSLRILKPSVPSRSAKSDLIVLNLDGNLVAVKRCAGNPAYVKREAIVHRFRVLWNERLPSQEA
jgi:hypothetical protein